MVVVPFERNGINLYTLFDLEWKYPLALKLTAGYIFLQLPENALLELLKINHYAPFEGLDTSATLLVHLLIVLFHSDINRLVSDPKGMYYTQTLSQSVAYFQALCAYKRFLADPAILLR